MNNKRTTIAGILGIVSAVAGVTMKYLSAGHLDAADITVLTGALTSLGLIFAKDGNK